MEATKGPSEQLLPLSLEELIVTFTRNLFLLLGNFFNYSSNPILNWMSGYQSNKAVILITACLNIRIFKDRTLKHSVLHDLITGCLNIRT